MTRAATGGSVQTARMPFDWNAATQGWATQSSTAAPW